MNKTKEINRKFGYGLYIKRTTTSKTERVGYLFESSDEAKVYRERHYPETTLWSVQSIRMNVEPVGVRKNEKY